MTTNNNPVVAAATAAVPATAKTPSQQAADLWCRLIAKDNRAAIAEARTLVSAGRTRGYVSGFLFGKEDFTETEMRLFLVGCFTCYFNEYLWPSMCRTFGEEMAKALEDRVASTLQIDRGKPEELKAYTNALRVALKLPIIP